MCLAGVNYDTEIDKLMLRCLHDFDEGLRVWKIDLAKLKDFKYHDYWLKWIEAGQKTLKTIFEKIYEEPVSVPQRVVSVDPPQDLSAIIGPNIDRPSIDNLSPSWGVIPSPPSGPSPSAPRGIPQWIPGGTHSQS